MFEKIYAECRDGIKASFDHVFHVTESEFEKVRQEVSEKTAALEEKIAQLETKIAMLPKI